MFLAEIRYCLPSFFFFTVIRRVAAFKIRLPSGSSFVFLFVYFLFSLLVTVCSQVDDEGASRERKKRLACLVLFRLVSVTRVVMGEGASSLGILYSLKEEAGLGDASLARRGAGSATLTVETLEKMIHKWEME